MSQRCCQHIAFMLILLHCGGCQSLNQWWRNGLRVGPDYCGVDLNTASTFLDAGSPYINTSATSSPLWWHAFNDPELTSLINTVYEQNLSLKAAVWRITEARLQREIAAANLLPQSQVATGQYAHTQNSLNVETAFPGFPITIDTWSKSLDASWELDLWGKIRRAVEAADAGIAVAEYDYDFLLVTLIGDVASLYIQIRSIDERLELARQNVKLQKGSLEIAEKRFKEGRTSKLDVVQARSNLAATQSLIPQLELARRQSLNALAVLLGMTPADIEYRLSSSGQLPVIPPTAVVGIPANLLQSRPDIRSAERQLAAQFEQIGIAESNLYPSFVISGTLGFQAARLSDLIGSGSYTGTIAPGFSWNILNYGRLVNGVQVERARVEQLCFGFQEKVLSAQREVEDAIIEFLKLQEQYLFDKQNEEANREAVELANVLFKEGKEDFNRVFVVQTNLVQAQDRLVSTQASIALALIQIYKSLGNGWQIRCADDGTLVQSEPTNFGSPILESSEFESNKVNESQPPDESDALYELGPVSVLGPEFKFAPTN